MSSKESSPSRHKRQHRHKSYIYLPFAYRVRRKAFYRFVVGSVVCLGLLCFIPYGVYRFTEGADTHTAEAVPAIVGPPETREEAPQLKSPHVSAPPATAESGAEAVVEVPKVLSLDSILETYRSATGLSEVQSLLLRGSYLEDGRRFEMKLAAKAPDLVRKTLTDDRLAMVCSYDGTQAKIEIQTGSIGEAVTQPLENAIYQKAIELEGACLSLADVSVEFESPLYDWQPDQLYRERPCWTVVSMLPGASQITHLIDQETGFEQVRYLNLLIDGTKYQLSIHFSDFRKDKALCLPYAYTLKVNGAIRGQAQIDSIARNPGLMPWMF